MADVVGESEVTFKDIQNALEDIVTSCKSCQQFQTLFPSCEVRDQKPTGKLILQRSSQEGKYLLVFVDIFS